MLKQQFHWNEHSNYEEQTQRNVRYHNASAGGYARELHCYVMPFSTVHHPDAKNRQDSRELSVS